MVAAGSWAIKTGQDVDSELDDWLQAEEGMLRQVTDLHHRSKHYHSKNASGAEPMNFPRHLMAIGLAVGLVEVIAGTLAGAWLYREETA